MIRATITVTIGLAVAACAGWLATGLLDGPWGMLPGGRLEGEAFACKDGRWGSFASLRELELEVRPSRPRSITTWSIVWRGDLFIPADFLTPWKRWPQQVQADDRIRLRIAGQIFECRAERVDDEAWIEELRTATATKYDLQPDGRAATLEVWWFRVVPR
jgi:hypothetical protein